MYRHAESCLTALRAECLNLSDFHYTAVQSFYALDTFDIRYKDTAACVMCE